MNRTTRLRSIIGAFACIVVPAAWGLPLLPGGTFVANYDCLLTTAGTGFGTCSAAHLSPNSVLEYGQVIWQQDHFGVLARVSGNTTAPGSGDARVDGDFVNELLVPPQGSLHAGDLATFRVPGHIDGKIDVDWADNFYSPCCGRLINAAVANVDFVWSSVVANGTDLFRGQTVAERHYSGDNHFTATVNEDVMIQGAFRVGEKFAFSEAVFLRVRAAAGLGPAVGHVEADFLHTGTIGPAVILDSAGNVVANPIILSATGYDFANPGAPANTPEPASAALIAAGLGATVAARAHSRRRRRV